MTREQLKQLEADLSYRSRYLRRGSNPKASEYSIPMLALTFLKFADNNYRRYEAEIFAEFPEANCRAHIQ